MTNARATMVARLQAVAKQSPDYTVGGVPASAWLDDLDAIEAEARVAALAEREALDVERLARAMADDGNTDPPLWDLMGPTVRILWRSQARRLAKRYAALAETPEAARAD
jgi:hypothetical protein